jgi:signal transduction histidine kinase
VESVLSLLQPTIPASITIDYKNNVTDECTFFGDQTQLHQIMVNIINNAVDAMDGEGTVTIRLSHVLATADELKQIPAIAGYDYCKIEIRDKGHGMDPSTIERIFEPFFTTKEVGKGTGLGLSTVHAIVKEHQGEILVASQLGHGTVFTLFIPEYSPKTATKTGA